MGWRRGQAKGPELRGRVLAERGVAVFAGADLAGARRAWADAEKKSFCAVEQDRLDVAAARAAWREI